MGRDGMGKSTGTAKIHMDGVGWTDGDYLFYPVTFSYGNGDELMVQRYEETSTRMG